MHLKMASAIAVGGVDFSDPSFVWREPEQLIADLIVDAMAAMPMTTSDAQVNSIPAIQLIKFYPGEHPR